MEPIDEEMDLEPAGQRGAPRNGLTQEAASHGKAARAGITTKVVLAGTFTVDPLTIALRFWMRTLGLRVDVDIAPYAQVLQTLLRPDSELAENRSGFNVLLLRIEDWIRDRKQEPAAANVEHVEKVAREVVAAAEDLQARTAARLLVVLCPASAALTDYYQQAFAAIEGELLTSLAALPRVRCWSPQAFAQLYPVAGIEDVRADRLGHIPYTTEFFAAVATFLSRQIAAELKPRPKVIAVDCDNTLWRGVCGEDGPEGVRITLMHRRLQQLLLRQYEAGVLLCLCSKNNASDVDAVFKAHLEMPLREEHIISARVNWEPKSSNLQSLADELGLGLSSFVFIDDSALECDEVRTHCPAVLTLQFPHTDLDVAHFLDHVWVFDRSGVTQEAKRRTAQYRENRARTEALQRSSSFEHFLASLNLRVDMVPMEQQQLPRVAELVQRTNQFNLTGIRRTASQIEELWRAGLTIDTISVTDRFGDYGLVGVVFSRQTSEAIEVDTLVLSCRVLGRGVEHRMVSELGRRAHEAGGVDVHFWFHPTARNDPARSFVERSFAAFESPRPSGDSSNQVRAFVVPANYCEQLSSCGHREPSALADAHEPAPTPAALSSVVHDWHAAAFRLSRVNDVVREMNLAFAGRRVADANHLNPRTPMETTVAALWTDVLGIDGIGVHANFFQMGGDSLSAVRTISRIGSVLGLELSLPEFLEQPTVAGVAEKLTGAREVSRIGRADRSELLPLSSAQQRLWFVDLLEDGAAAYHIAWGARLSGALNRRALQGALDDILRRHEALRTVFTSNEGTPMQQVMSPARFALEFDDVERESEEKLSFMEREVAARFDLQRGPLIRAKVLRLAVDQHLLLLTVHHIVADGWSIGVLLGELSLLYARHLDGGVDSLPELDTQYGDYAYWQQCQQPTEQLRYWKQQLQGVPELLRLPTDRPRPPMQSYCGAAVDALVEPQLVEGLRGLARRLNVTLPIVLHGAWSIVLGRISGQDDIVVGVPMANRRDSQLEGLIGLFVNTLPIRMLLQNELTVEDLLQQLRATMFGAYANQDAPFERIVEALQPARRSSHSPVVQVMLVNQNTPRGELHLPGITVEEQQLPIRSAHFDLVLSLLDSCSGIAATLIYATDLFDESTVARWLGYFVAALRGMVSEPQAAIGSLRLMSAEERNRLHEFNETRIEFPKEPLVHHLIEAQARRRPQAFALLHEGHSLTYEELDSRASLLAERLIAMGVGPDGPVAVCLDRGMDLAVSVLAIFKAGGAFVPLDPAYPTERLAYMMEDAAPRVLLAHSKFIGMLPDTTAAVVFLEWGWPNALHGSRAAGTSATAPTRKNLAYIIYTSGSTGMPKGVMVEHGGLVNLAYCQQELLRVDEHSRVLQFASPSFDAFIWEYVMALSVGACLCLASRDELTPGEPLFQTLRAYAITHMTVPPVALQALPGSEGLKLGTIIVAGEACPVAVAQRWGRGRRFINGYGPTETTVCATVYEWRAEASETVPIGRPMPNTRIYILDRNREPVPVGVAGEIYIGGAGLARGYSRRPDLTEGRFVPDHLVREAAGARLYRSGDLGRWRADGIVEFLGRIDDQVKLRGFRIELGEIETQLARHAGVKDVIVVARESNGEKRLVAYMTKRGAATPALEDLRAHLRAALPEYMIPSAFVVLGAFKLTPNGKIDRRALPAPEASAFVAREYHAPQGRVEQILADIWRDLLSMDQIGRQDNFFELGGHSLLAVKVLARINEALGSALQVTDFYRCPSVAELALRIDHVVAEDPVIDLVTEARLDHDIIRPHEVNPLVATRRLPERHVLLTGATGFVGRFLVERLLRNTSATIHCLVRGESHHEALARIRAAMMKWDLWRNDFAHRLIAVPADLRRPLLGLDQATYSGLSNNIDSIYHSATSMNHLESYAMARAVNVEGSKELVRFAARGRPKLINYISTLGVFDPTPAGSECVVHESTPIETKRHRASHGYVGSKWVGEKIFMTANERGIPCNIFRLGLIWADTKLGRYDELQQGYRVLKSCLLSGYGIKNYRYGMAPTPVDYAAEAVIFLANSHPHGGECFHISSVRQVDEGLFERCNRVAGAGLQLKSHYDWIQEVRRRHQEGQSLPAVPLIEFAFSMDEESFVRHDDDSRRQRTKISCANSHRELEAAGIVAPYLDDDLLKLSIRSMLLRDDELRASRVGSNAWPVLTG